jgi:hypothetical protein
MHFPVRVKEVMGGFEILHPFRRKKTCSETCGSRFIVGKKDRSAAVPLQKSRGLFRRRARMNCLSVCEDEFPELKGERVFPPDEGKENRPGSACTVLRSTPGRSSGPAVFLPVRKRRFALGRFSRCHFFGNLLQPQEPAFFKELVKLGFARAEHLEIFLRFTQKDGQFPAPEGLLPVFLEFFPQSGLQCFDIFINPLQASEIRQ